MAQNGQPSDPTQDPMQDAVYANVNDAALQPPMPAADAQPHDALLAGPPGMMAAVAAAIGTTPGAAAPPQLPALDTQGGLGVEVPTTPIAPAAPPPGDPSP